MSEGDDREEFIISGSEESLLAAVCSRAHALKQFVFHFPERQRLSLQLAVLRHQHRKLVQIAISAVPLSFVADFVLFSY